MIDIDELERFAKKAGSDEWGAFDYMPPGTHEGVHVWDRAGDAVCECFANLGHLPEGVTEIDRAEFIAAANPAAILSLTAELHQLRRFAGLMFSAHRNGGWPADVDGYDIQEWALQCGLIEERQVTGPCGETCSCAEGADFPATCYFNTALGKVVRDSALVQKGDSP